MTLKKNSKTSGFTIIEVLVASGVSLLLGLCVLNAFIQSKRSFDHSAGTIELVQATRPASDRISQYLTSAVSIPGESTVVFPQNNPTSLQNFGTPGKDNERGETIVLDEPSTWPSYIVFRTTEDFLSPTFNPNEIMDIINGNINGITDHGKLLSTYKTDTHRVFDYILWWEDSNLDKLSGYDNALMLARVLPLDTDGDEIFEFRPDSWAAIGADPWADLDPDIPPRVIASGGRGTNGGEGLASANFLAAGSNGVNVSLLARQRVRNHTEVQSKEYRLDTVIQLPSLTMGQ